MTRDGDPMTTKCRCCGEGEVYERGGFEICGICGWRDDPSQAAHPDMPGGANDLSLTGTRQWWSRHHAPLPGIGDFPAGGVAGTRRIP